MMIAEQEDAGEELNRPEDLEERMTQIRQRGYEVRGFLGDYYTQLRARLEAGMRFGQRKADKFT